MKILIKNGANLEHRSRQNLNPLLTAIMRGKTEVVRILLSEGAKIDLNTINLAALDKLREMKPEIRNLLEEFGGW